jgi:Ca2+-binding RTX toxin-like protein
MADDVATTSTDNVTQTSGDDTLTLSDPNQLELLDFFDGAGGKDTILVTFAGAFASIGGLQTDASHGFHNYEALSFAQTSSLQILIEATQFGSGLISTSLTIIGSAGSLSDSILISGASNFSAAAFTFANWVANAGVDYLIIEGTAAANAITGSSATDALEGFQGNDTLDGGIGDDILAGGRGKDTLSGNFGDDLFRFDHAKDSLSRGGRDVILDYEAGELIALTNVDANSLRKGNQVFKFIGAQKFHDKAGELQVKFNGTIAIVSGDRNGDGKADFQIEVHTSSALVQTDFLL